MGKKGLEDQIRKIIDDIKNHIALKSSFRDETLRVMERTLQEVSDIDESQLFGPQDIDEAIRYSKLIYENLKQNPSGPALWHAVKDFRTLINSLPKISEHEQQRQSYAKAATKLRYTEFSKYALYEGIACWILRSLSVISFLATLHYTYQVFVEHEYQTVLSGIFPILIDSTHQNEWFYIALRFGFVTIGLALSVYLGGLASQHFFMSRRYRLNALDISTAPDFIAQLDENKKKEIIEQLSKKIFGNAWTFRFDGKAAERDKKQ